MFRSGRSRVQRRPLGLALAKDIHRLAEHPWRCSHTNYPSTFDIPDQGPFFNH